MQIGNTTEVYGIGTKKYHWLSAVLVIAMLGVGWYMSDLDNSPDKFRIYGLHKSFGAIVFMLSVIRIAWAFSQPSPRFLLTGPGSRAKYIASKSVHGMLYLWLLAMPLSGWVMSNAAGYPVSVFGWFTMPTLVDKSKAIGGFAHEMHETLPVIGLILITVHVGAALYHHIVEKDDTLRRMMPGYRLPSD